ncbi:hypothetical protein FHS81_000394 [Pseudochelatococcus contaminans]|uniref:Uncharacterized protein n=1 Tax=Pseudochelatococcus contaminans TaxID=1538103 RepID=A0A7W6EEU4_9HYPH|nr:hypothetical protein [Pseudochelatococcus contaminans]
MSEVHISAILRVLVSDEGRAAAPVSSMGVGVSRSRQPAALQDPDMKNGIN